MEPGYFLKIDEFHCLLQTAESPRDRLVLLLLGGVGLRVGEIVQIKVEDLDLEAGYLFVRASNARSKKDRTVILIPPAVAELRRYLTDDTIDHDYLFPGRTSGHLSSRQIQLILNSLAEKAGLQITKYRDKAGRSRHRVTPHLLRHSFAVWSIECGVPIYDLKEQLGQSTLAATMLYVQATPNHQKESYQRCGLSDKLMPTVEGDQGQMNKPKKKIPAGATG